MSLLQHELPRDAFSELACFRVELYACLTGRRDALFELGDALLCADGPVRTLVELSLAPEFRRGHGALYGGVNRGHLGCAGCWRDCRFPGRQEGSWSWRSM